MTLTVPAETRTLQVPGTTFGGNWTQAFSETAFEPSAFPASPETPDGRKLTVPAETA